MKSFNSVQYVVWEMTFIVKCNVKCKEKFEELSNSIAFVKSLNVWRIFVQMSVHLLINGQLKWTYTLHILDWQINSTFNEFHFQEYPKIKGLP